MKIEEPIKTTVEELKKLLHVKNFVGEPIETDDKVLIPIMKMGIGFGAGMGHGKGSNKGSGSGAGAGAGIEPVAMIVIFKGIKGPEGVKAIPLTPPGKTGRMIQEIGTVAMEMIKEHKEKGKKEE